MENEPQPGPSNFAATTSNNENDSPEDSYSNTPTGSELAIELHSDDSAQELQCQVVTEEQVNRQVALLQWAQEQNSLRRGFIGIVHEFVGDNMLKPIHLSNLVGYIMVEHAFQLRVIDPPIGNCGDVNLYGLGMCVCIHIPNVLNNPHVSPECGLRLTGMLEPTVRNCFQFLDAEGLLLYGDEIYFAMNVIIKLHNPGAPPLYVEAIIDCPESEYEAREKFQLKFTRHINYKCYFQIRHPSIALRIETDHMLVPTHSRIVLQHVLTNKYLASEFGEFNETIFGVENIVDLRTYIDETLHMNENIFIIHLGSMDGWN